MSDCPLKSGPERSINLKQVRQEPEPWTKTDHFKQTSDTSTCAAVAAKNKGLSACCGFRLLSSAPQGCQPPGNTAGESSFHITDANVLSLRLCQNPCIAGLQTNAHGEAWSNKNTIQLWSQFVRQHNPCKKQRISAFLVWQMRDVWDND